MPPLYDDRTACRVLVRAHSLMTDDSSGADDASRTTARLSIRTPSDTDRCDRPQAPPRRARGPRPDHAPDGVQRDRAPSRARAQFAVIRGSTAEPAPPPPARRRAVARGIARLENSVAFEPATSIAKTDVDLRAIEAPPDDEEMASAPHRTPSRRAALVLCAVALAALALVVASLVAGAPSTSRTPAPSASRTPTGTG